MMTAELKKTKKRHKKILQGYCLECFSLFFFVPGVGKGTFLDIYIQPDQLFPEQNWL